MALITIGPLKNQGTRDQTPNYTQETLCLKKGPLVRGPIILEMCHYLVALGLDYLFGTFRLGTIRQCTPRKAPLRYTCI